MRHSVDGCIVWNAHNTVLGEEARLIYIVPVCYVKTGRYGKTCYCKALEQWARAKLCGVEHRAPPIFGRATITLGIGPHCSYRLELFIDNIHNVNSTQNRCAHIILTHSPIKGVAVC